MAKLEQMIKELCPEGVQCVELKRVCRFQNGFAFKSDKFKSEGLPILRIANIVDGIISDDGYVYFDNNDYKENLTSYIVKNNDIVVAMSGATTGKIGINRNDKIFYLNQRVGLFIPDECCLDRMYLYYWLMSKNTEILSISSGTGAQPNLSSEKMMSFIIPLPPMIIQKEIVIKLNSFAEYINCLKEELAARKTQYLHYSYELLSSNNNTTSLKDVCVIEKGKTPIQKAENGEYPLVVTTSERKTCNTYQFDASAVCIPLVSSRGHGVASLNHVYYQTGKFALGNILCAVMPKSSSGLNPKYLYYYLELKKDYLLVPLMKGGANVSLHIDDIERVKIPIPSLAEQERIVSILDRFDKLCNDISEGLPAEIEARRKQYEYYRDRLLSFEERKNA